MSYHNIIVNIQAGLAELTINRPSKLNALNKETIAELGVAFKDLDQKQEVKCIIVTGSGEKAFVAGADISEFANFSVEQGQELSQDGHDSLFNLVENLSTPVIAAVNGFALGGGLELAMSCHIRVFSEKARVGLPETSLGVIPGYGGTQRLAQLIGRGRALELVMTAAMIKADRAEAIGLANYVVAPEELMNKAREIAAAIMKNSSKAIASAIVAVNANYTDGVDGFHSEVVEFGKCFGTDHFKEGTTAFLEKRKAIFS